MPHAKFAGYASACCALLQGYVQAKSGKKTALNLRCRVDEYMFKSKNETAEGRINTRNEASGAFKLALIGATFAAGMNMSSIKPAIRADAARSMPKADPAFVFKAELRHNCHPSSGGYEIPYLPLNMFNVRKSIAHEDEYGSARTAMELSSILKSIARVNHKRVTPYMGAAYLEKVLNAVSYASERLGIPKEYILSQWLMESGRMQSNALPFLDRNNLGGFMHDRHTPMRFNSPMAFAHAYTRTLKHADVQDIHSLSEFVIALYRSHYFENESISSYLSKVNGVLQGICGINSNANIANSRICDVLASNQLRKRHNIS
jgi:hypothetical protein